MKQKKVQLSNEQEKNSIQYELNNENENENVKLLNSANKNIKKYLSGLDLFNLTLALAGVQFTWSVELAYGTPYLLSLGLPKSLTALVWLAGPLSGLIMQPLIGFYSDRCTSKYGRRRPFIAVGSLLVVICIFCIAYSKELGSILSFGNNSKIITIFIAVLSFYGLDFSINVVQACCRALSIDIAPGEQQNDASIWASRMIGIGNIFGYFMGYIDLRKYLGFLGSTQLKCLCIIANLILFLCVVITCLKTNEEVINLDEKNETKVKWYTPLVNIVQNLSHLPNPIQKVCNVQFWSWIGWFPFLFYTTAWINYIFKLNIKVENISDNNLDDEATRIGSFALLIYSIISLLASFIFPFFKKIYDTYSINYKADPQGFYKKVWIFSEVFLALIFFSTWFVDQIWQAVIIISLCGISWAVSMWVPFVLIGEYLDGTTKSSSKKNKILTSESLNESSSSINNNDIIKSTNTSINSEEIQEDDDTISLVNKEEEEESQQISSGVILGIHNMYVVLPQFVVTFLSSIFFALLKSIPNINEDEFDSFGWVLRFGGVGAILSTFLIPKINFKVKKN